MFISNAEKKHIEYKLTYLENWLCKLESSIDSLDATCSALLKIATNKAKLDAEQSSVTVTVHAPHGLKKDGTPKTKPGPKGKKQ